MKTITWNEIYEMGEDGEPHCTTIFYSKKLEELLVNNGYKLVHRRRAKYIVIYSCSRRYSLHNIIYNKDIYTFDDNSSDICSTDQTSKCCDNPNIIENIVLNKPFWVCRNCKREIL